MSDTQPHQSDITEIFSEFSGTPDGPLVVLIHGSLDRSAGMTLMARHLHSRFRVLRYDRRGYGKSWPHRGPFSISDQVDDLTQILGDQSAVIFGHSFGGNIALAAAERLGPQILGVSTFETPLSWMPWWPGTTAGAIGVAAGEAEAAEKFMIRLIGHKRWDQLPDRTKRERRREGIALVGELTALRQNAPWSPEGITCPVYAGFGSRGLPHHAEGARWISAHVSRGTLVEISEAGHGAPMTHALDCAQALVSVHFDG